MHLPDVELCILCNKVSSRRNNRVKLDHYEFETYSRVEGQFQLDGHAQSPFDISRFRVERKVIQVLHGADRVNTKGIKDIGAKDSHQPSARLIEGWILWHERYDENDVTPASR
jgi:hypothetical protein